MSLRSPRGGKKASTPHVSPLGRQAHTGSLQETNLLLVWCSCRAVPEPHRGPTEPQQGWRTALEGSWPGLGTFHTAQELMRSCSSTSMTNNLLPGRLDPTLAEFWYSLISWTSCPMSIVCSEYLPREDNRTSYVWFPFVLPPLMFVPGLM